MRFSTEGIARASAYHPWRAVGGWLGVIVAAFVCIGALLGGGLTTDGAPTNNPASKRAEAIIDRSFPPAQRRELTDVLIVRSSQYSVDAPRFRDFESDLVREIRGVSGVASVQSYVSDRDPSLVSRDRHATLIQIDVPDDGDIDGVLDIVNGSSSAQAFTIAITGTDTLNHDFNELSQHDLKSGELQFGLPAALIVLVLVFGAVVAGLIPLLMAIVSIIVALGLTALLSLEFGLSIFIVNMITGMGLALGIDYSLFIVSRYREERGGGRAQTRRDHRLGSDREPRRPLQRHRLRGRDVRDADRAELDHAEPRRGRDPRRDRIGADGIDAPAGAARVDRRRRQPTARSRHRQPLDRGDEPGGPLLASNRGGGAAQARLEPRGGGDPAAPVGVAHPRHQHRRDGRRHPA